MRYDYDIFHTPGKDMFIADLLSRPNSGAVCDEFQLFSERIQSISVDVSRKIERRTEVPEVVALYGPFLSDSCRDYIRRFAGESLSYPIRKKTNWSSCLRWSRTS
ncbi:uncharacterized protein [Watersipora subatra]|uniref:uncharacterized protein isoform X2 n=1 Tax=Watersipora subatra TaxID=2589382 RepID=UPI00355B5A8C